MVAHRVTMLRLALKQVCDRFESPVRVPWSTGAFTWSVLKRAKLVKEQERIEVRQRSGGKGPLHDEAVALNGALRPNGA